MTDRQEVSEVVYRGQSVHSVRRREDPEGHDKSEGEDVYS